MRAVCATHGAATLPERSRSHEKAVPARAVIITTAATVPVLAADPVPTAEETAVLVVRDRRVGRTRQKPKTAELKATATQGRWRLMNRPSSAPRKSSSGYL